MLEFCKKLEFKKIDELKKNTWHTLQEDFKILCNPYTFGDSYALFKTKEHTLLNLNDCVVSTEQAAARLAKQVGTVDVLFTQFGYANKVENTPDTAERQAASREKLQRIRYQFEQLKPTYIVPFASYIYFCHTDNAYMNDGIHKIDTVHTFIENELHAKSIVMYPGDQWAIGENWDSLAAIEKYLPDYANVPKQPLLHPVKIELAQLKAQGLQFIETLINGYPALKKRMDAKQMKIFLTDYNRSFVFSGKTGLHEAEFPAETCDILLNSDSLNYFFKFLWGWQTLAINAKYQVPAKGNYENVHFFLELAAKLNSKTPYNRIFPPLPLRVIRKLKQVLLPG